MGAPWSFKLFIAGLLLMGGSLLAARAYLAPPRGKIARRKGKKKENIEVESVTATGVSAYDRRVGYSFLVVAGIGALLALGGAVWGYVGAPPVTPASRAAPRRPGSVPVMFATPPGAAGTPAASPTP